MTDRIIMEHGSGGQATSELIREIFEQNFSNDVLNAMEDAAVVAGTKKIAITTDSFVVTPVEFPGGDIGRLSICGTVNDLLMRGATPKYITCGFILEVGCEIETIKRVVKSMAETAKEAGVIVVAGDTKVIDGNGGFYINTTGVGLFEVDCDIKAANAKVDDVIIASGNMGDHHACILSQRMGIKNTIKSDNAPLTDMVRGLIDNGIEVRTLRDVTRGGLGTVLCELAEASKKEFEISEELIPVNPMVKDFCGLLGLDPLYMGNEGKLIAIVSKKDADKALSIIKANNYGKDACIIGRVNEMADFPRVIQKSSIGGRRQVGILQGEGLPRIC